MEANFKLVDQMSEFWGWTKDAAGGGRNMA